MSSEIITTQDIDRYEEVRKKLYDIASESYRKATPKDVIKEKDGFSYAEFSYMLHEFRKLHPNTTIQVITDRFNEKYLAFECTIVITDNITHESQSGTCVHPVPAFNQGTDNIKTIKQIQNLLSNAKKSALTGAMRHCFSNFGICSDLYDTEIIEEVTDQQKERFLSLIDEILDITITETDPIRLQEKENSRSVWIKSLNDKWNNITSLKIAESFLSQLTEKVKQTKERNNASTK